MRKIAQLLISLGFGIFIIWYFTDKLSVSQIESIKEAFFKANYMWLILSVFCGIASHLSRAQRWRMLLAPKGKHTPRFDNTFFAVMIMYFANLFFPRLGEGVRCTIMFKYEKISLVKGVGTMITERILDLIVLVCLIGFSIIFAYDKIMEAKIRYERALLDFIKADAEKSYAIYYILAAVCIVLCLLAIFLYIKKGEGIVKKVKQTIQKIVKNLINSILSIRYLSKPWLFLFHTFFIWFMYFVMMYIAFFTLPETSSLSLMSGLLCLIAGGFAIIAVQGGLGLYPVVISQVLILYNISEPIGLALGWMVWTIQTLMIISLGLFSLVALPLVNRGKN